MKYDIEPINTSDYLNMVNQGFETAKDYVKICYYNLNGKIFALLKSGVGYKFGDFIEADKKPKDIQKFLDTQTEQLKQAHETLKSSYADNPDPTLNSFTFNPEEN